MPPSTHLWGIRLSERAAEALVHRERFKVFSEMYMVRDFRLVLCADVPDHAAEDARRALQCVVEAEGMNGGLDHEPLIISEMRSHHTRHTDDQVGARGGGVLTVICAL